MDDVRVASVFLGRSMVTMPTLVRKMDKNSICSILRDCGMDSMMIRCGPKILWCEWFLTLQHLFHTSALNFWTVLYVYSFYQWWQAGSYHRIKGAMKIF